MASTIVSLALFVYEMSVSPFNSWSIFCLILFLVSIVAFVLNQVFYRQFKVRDPSRYEQQECPHCHALNEKKAEFCKNCGKPLH